GQGAAAEVVDGSTDAAAEEGAAATSEGLVAREQGVVHGGRSLVEQTAAKDVHRGAGGIGRIVSHDVVVEVQGGPHLVEDTGASQGRVLIADCAALFDG